MNVCFSRRKVLTFRFRVDFRPYDHSAELLFNGSDFNHDGIFSRDELEQEFKKYDANGKEFKFYTGIREYPLRSNRVSGNNADMFGSFHKLVKRPMYA